MVDILGNVLELQLISDIEIKEFDIVDGDLFTSPDEDASIDHEGLIRSIDDVVLGHYKSFEAFYELWLSAYLVSLKHDSLAIVADRVYRLHLARKVRSKRKIGIEIRMEEYELVGSAAIGLHCRVLLL